MTRQRPVRRAAMWMGSRSTRRTAMHNRQRTVFYLPGPRYAACDDEPDGHLHFTVVTLTRNDSGWTAGRRSLPGRRERQPNGRSRSRRIMVQAAERRDRVEVAQDFVARQVREFPVRRGRCQRHRDSQQDRPRRSARGRSPVIPTGSPDRGWRRSLPDGAAQRRLQGRRPGWREETSRLQKFTDDAFPERRCRFRRRSRIGGCGLRYGLG